MDDHRFLLAYLYVLFLFVFFLQFFHMKIKKLLFHHYYYYYSFFQVKNYDCYLLIVHVYIVYMLNKINNKEHY